MDFGNTKYFNQKKRVITLRKGRGAKPGYVTMNGAKIVSRRPTIYYIMNNGAIRALSNANTAAIPSGLKYKVLKGKAPAKPKNVGNAAALNAVKAKRTYVRKAGAFPLKPRQAVLNKARANTILDKRRAALVKARAAKKMHVKNLPGWYNNNGNLFGPIKANRPKRDPRLNNTQVPNGNNNAKNNAAKNAASNTVSKLEKVAGVNNTTANAAANAAAAAAKVVTPSSASSTKAANIANAASNGATSAVQALPVNERKNKNAVAAAAAAGASQAANAAKNGNSTTSEAKNIGAAAGTAVTNAKKLKVN